VDVAVALKLELGDLGCHSPNTPTEIRRTCLRCWVRLWHRINGRSRDVLRMQIDELALRIDECLEFLQMDVAAFIGILAAGRRLGGNRTKHREHHSGEDQNPSHR
jgi:hypothetical protein